MSPETRAAFRAGVVAGLPFLLILIPFALVLGVAAAEAGFTLGQIFAFSTLVLAGASQLTAVQLMAEGAPLVVVLISALAVNLRLLMYSAALTPWLGAASPGWRAAASYVVIDNSFALSVQRFPVELDWGVPQRLAFLFGTAAVLAAPWPAATALGATLGRAIPASWALDFAVPVAFLGIVAPSLRQVPHAAAAATGFGLAVALRGLPSGTGLLVAAPIAMTVGAVLETRLARRAGR